MVNNFFPKYQQEPVKVKAELVKVRGKTIIYGNSVYQIHNITSLSFVDLTTEKKITKQSFIYYLILLFIGIVLVIAPDITARILGLLILGLDIWLFVKHRRNRITERYGMLMSLNSGEKIILVSSTIEWVIEAIVELYEYMNTEELKSFNIVQDHSIKVGTSFGSSFISGGKVQGDVVSAAID